jgi:hypothetical protein
MSYIPADRIPRGSFREGRYTELTPQVQLEFPYGFMTNEVVVASGNGGAALGVSGIALIRTGDTAGGYASLESYDVGRHQAGQGLVTHFDCAFTEGVANSHQIVGVGASDSEGVFVGYSGVDFGLFTFGEDFKTHTPQSTWNLDKADGTGKLPAIDWTKGQQYRIEAMTAVLGGFVRLSLMDPNDGEWVCVHQQNALNAFGQSVIKQLNWGAFAEAHSDTSATNLEVHLGTYGQFLEGKEANSIITRSVKVSSKFTPKNTEQFALAIRNKSVMDNGRTNRIIAVPQSVIIFNNSIEPLKLRIGVAAVFTGADWQDAGSNSATQYSTSGVLVANPVVVNEYTIAGDSSREIAFSETSKIIPGATGTYTTEVGEGDNYSLSFVWEEWI